MTSILNYFIIVIIGILQISGYVSATPTPHKLLHGIAMHGDLKYQQDQPFDYVSVDAPKGGHIRLAAVGTFNCLNPFITKGISPAGLSLWSETLVFETLMKRSADEPFSLYGLIAEKVDMAPDRSSITFHINPAAKWPDGQKITAEDVQFSHQTLRDFGRPNLRLFYHKVADVEIIDLQTIKFTFKAYPQTATENTNADNNPKYDPEAPLLIALMAVLPKHLLKDVDFEKINLEPMVGSGPYEIATVDPGKKIVYQRRADYWGRNLPVNAGQANFDTITYDYYRDQHVAFEAFKAHAYDLRDESDIAQWHTAYNFKAINQGHVKKLELLSARPVGMYAFAFNTRRSIFSDRRVRQALNYAFDFEWLNKNLFHSAYKRQSSFYQNSDLEPTTTFESQHNGQEIDLLSTLVPDQLSEIMQQSGQPPIRYDNPQQQRRGLTHAKELLQQAGWHVDHKGVLRDTNNQPFKFEVLLHNPDDEKIALALARNLKKLGVQCVVRVVDTAQFESRRMNFDFDMIIQLWGQSNSPGNEQVYYWRSDAADEPGSRNYCGIKSAAVDKLCTMIASAKDRSTLISAGRALDRLLINGCYVIPLFYHDKAYVAYWDQLGFPPYNPRVGTKLLTLWSPPRIKAQHTLQK